MITDEALDELERLSATSDSGPADATHLDLLAAARTYLPLLVDELRVLRSGREVGTSRDLERKKAQPGEHVPYPHEHSPDVPRLLLPADFDDYGWEVESKGVFSDGAVALGDHDVKVTFYDPERLKQDIESDLARDPYVAFERLVVVESVTLENMEQAVSRLDRAFLALS